MWPFKQRESKPEVWRIKVGELVRHKLTGEQLLVIRAQYVQHGPVMLLHGWEVRNKAMQVFLCSGAELEQWQEMKPVETSRASRFVIVPKKS